MLKKKSNNNTKRARTRRSLRSTPVLVSVPDDRQVFTINPVSPFVGQLVISTILGLKNLLHDFGYRVRSMDGQRKSVRYIISLFERLSDGDAVDLLKYLTSVEICRLDNLEEPPRPDFIRNKFCSIFGGEWSRFIRKRLVRRSNGTYNKKYLGFVMGLLQLKRFCPPLSEELREKARLKHKITLSQFKVTPEPIMESIKHVTDVLFPVGWDLENFKKKPSFVPTTNSCFEATRSSGGVQAYYLEDNELSLTPDHFYGFVEFVVGRPLEIRMRPQGELNREVLLNRIRRSYTTPSAKVEVVEDPLKARIITKNNHFFNLIKPYQKAIHGHLKEFDQFRLIGKTICQDDIKWLTTDIKDSDLLISGDYSAATDNLNQDASVYCLHLILERMRSKWASCPEDLLLASQSLGNLKIHSGNDVFSQTNGQLMGSLLSFPILCIINYAVWALNKRNQTGFFPSLSTDGSGAKVLINGDDIGFVASRKEYDAWWNLVPQVGLSPSIGKNYASMKFLTLNSQIYLRNSTQVPWMNQALLLPLDKGKSNRIRQDNQLENERSPIESLGSMHDEFLKGCRSKYFGSATFIKFHMEELRKTPRNLFGPVHLGGLGATEAREIKISTPQLIVAFGLSQNLFSQPSSCPKTSQTSYLGELEKGWSYRTEKIYVQDDFPADESDITDRIEKYKRSLQGLLSWLIPLGMQFNDCKKDFQWYKNIRRMLVSEGRLDKMTPEQYLEAPSILRVIVTSKSVDNDLLSDC